MSHNDVPAYGLWSLVIINSVVFIFFAFSFFKPKTPRDWKRVNHALMEPSAFMEVCHV
jgi:hypothetical protein